jgi:hypothetical protein
LTAAVDDENAPAAATLALAYGSVSSVDRAIFHAPQRFFATNRRFHMSFRNTSTTLAVAAAFSLAAVAPATATPTPPADRFQSTLTHYETVRVALVADRWDAPANAAAKKLEAELTALAAAPTAEAAAVPSGKLADVKGLLPEIRAAAGKLVAATDLRTARDAFYEVSKPLVRWQAATGRQAPVVAYCSMAKRSWLQPSPQPIGNPYYGKQMERCGEIMQ